MSFHSRVFNPGRWQVITAGDRDVGMIDGEHRPDEARARALYERLGMAEEARHGEGEIRIRMRSA